MNVDNAIVDINVNLNGIINIDGITVLVYSDPIGSSALALAAAARINTRTIAIIIFRAAATTAATVAATIAVTAATTETVVPPVIHDTTIGGLAAPIMGKGGIVVAAGPCRFCWQTNTGIDFWQGLATNTALGIVIVARGRLILSPCQLLEITACVIGLATAGGKEINFGTTIISSFHTDNASILSNLLFPNTSQRLGEIRMSAILPFFDFFLELSRGKVNDFLNRFLLFFLLSL